MKKSTRILALTALLGSMVLPVACTPWDTEYLEIAGERIARPAFLTERRLSANGMDFQLWERMHKRGEPANVYIEGDGVSTYLNRNLSEDPTPTNPVALHLASHDNATNLGYISRPCQFRESQDEKACPSKFWGTRRFSPEVIAAYDEALTEMKNRYGITEFNLIGYDGGANIAAALAAGRKDVASLRTVAGNLVPLVAYQKTGQVLDNDSILANDIATALAGVPQHHFIGAGDQDIPPSIYHSFRQSMGPSECVHYTLVQDADHGRGWVDKWPGLLKATLSCPKAIDENFVHQPLPPRPDYAGHGQK